SIPSDSILVAVLVLDTLCTTGPLGISTNANSSQGPFTTPLHPTDPTSQPQVSSPLFNCFLFHHFTGTHPQTLSLLPFFFKSKELKFAIERPLPKKSRTKNK